jgi:hypothetical protein
MYVPQWQLQCILNIIHIFAIIRFMVDNVSFDSRDIEIKWTELIKKSTVFLIISVAAKIRVVVLYIPCLVLLTNKSQVGIALDSPRMDYR